jgi:hypothetical protein
MLSEKEYQRKELMMFINQTNCYFDSIAEFVESLENQDILEQLDWIENGSYGAGACFALQITYNGITKRCNANARIGGVLLKALYGNNFRAWKKLPKDLQDAINNAITTWLNQPKNFAQIYRGHK